MDLYLIVITSIVGLILLRYLLPRSQKNLTGQRCLITGAGSGIGRLMALQFAKEGCDLSLWDINKEAVDTVAKEVQEVYKQKQTNQRVVSYQCDVSQRENVYAVAAQVKKDLGKIDIVVNNAGIVSGHTVWELKDEAVERVFRVNSLASDMGDQGIPQRDDI